MTAVHRALAPGDASDLEQRSGQPFYHSAVLQRAAEKAQPTFGYLKDCQHRTSTLDDHERIDIHYTA
jgi:hypothetical protein